MRMKLRDAAAVIRSKNSGPFELTFDVILKDKKMYDALVQSAVLAEENIARLYGIPLADVLSTITFEPALAVKVTIRRPLGSGDLGDRDIYGAQQHAPLMALEFEG